MTTVLDGAKPYFRFFEEISAIPRESGDEARVTDYLVAFAQERGLRYVRDESGNLVVFKPATPGYESVEPVILQAHTDMVCLARDGVEHDFGTDPIDLVVGDDGWLRARGTSLGADDGCGVAAILYVLDREGLRHPALECVFTVEEEVGMLGAARLDYSLLSARRMVGLDAKDENECLVASAGGRRFTLTRRAPLERATGTAVEIVVDGLVGGHPGVEIHKGGANAVRVLGRVLDGIRRAGADFRIAEIHGGDKGNAIPGSCRAVVMVDASAAAAVVALAEAAGSAQVSQRSFTDPAMTVAVRTIDGERDVLGGEATAALCDALLLLPNGVLQMSPVFADAVQTSSNVAALHVEDGLSTIILSARGSVEAQLDDVSADIERVAAMTGFDSEAGAAYPGMPFMPHSPFRDLYDAVMTEQWGSGIDMLAAHAGIELGYFAQRMPGIETVALGPFITGAHTFDEAVQVASFERICLLLAAFLERLADAPAPTSTSL